MPVKQYRMYPALEGAAVALVTLVALLSSIYFIYVQAKDAVEEEIKEGLVRNVSAAATTIDGDRHRTFTGDTDPDDPAYVEFLGKLEAIRQASAYVRYLYTCISLDGNVYFIANPSPQEDGDGDGQPDAAPQLMDPYEGPGSALLEALATNQPTVDEEPYTDQWGTFYSAYAPFYDSQGRFVGVLGMDLEQSGFEARLQPTLTSTRRAALTTIVIAILCGVAVWFFRRVSWQLSQSRVRLAGELDAANRVATELRGVSYDYLNAVNAQVRRWLDTVREASASAQRQPIQASDGQLALARLHSATEGLEGFVELLDDYIKAKSGAYPVCESDFELAPRVEGLSEDLASIAATMRVTHTWSVSSDLPSHVHGDWNALAYIVSICVQSEMLTQSGQTIAIHFDLEDEGIHEFVLRIRLGYAPRRVRASKTDNIFDPFAGGQGSPSERVPVFRLAAARLVTQLLGGDISVTDVEPDSLQMTIRVPVKKAEHD